MGIDAARAEALVLAGRLFHSRGWVPATAGNFSFRIDQDSIAITESGCHKGELSAKNLMRTDLEGRPLDAGRKASAETLLHCQIYGQQEKAGAVLHTHSPASTVLSRHCDSVCLDGYELLKVFDGIRTHEASARIPVFENDQDMRRLSAAVAADMAAGGACHGYLIRGHGLYAWGRTVDEARHRVEALEFMFECELRTLHAGRHARLNLNGGDQ